MCILLIHNPFLDFRTQTKHPFWDSKLRISISLPDPKGPLQAKSTGPIISVNINLFLILVSDTNINENQNRSAYKRLSCLPFC